MSELWAALCLVAVIEGLFLFIAPGAWKRSAARLLEMGDEQVRRIGGIILMVGLVTLWVMRAA